MSLESKLNYEGKGLLSRISNKIKNSITAKAIAYGLAGSLALGGVYCGGKDGDGGSNAPGISKVAYYKDFDGDGYGNPLDKIFDVSQPLGYVTDNTDCDDNNANINPSRTEIEYNLLDDDCNPNSLDDDLDGDGFYILNGTIDCNDSNNTIYPGAVEVCNLVDDNCSGVIDENVCTNLSSVWNVVYDKGSDYSAQDISVDNSGNVYVVGFGTNLAGTGNQDILTIKYDNNGDELFDIVYDSASFNDTAYGIETDDLGNAYVVGSSPFGDLIIIKYDPFGEIIWKDNYKPIVGNVYGMDVALGNNNIYVTGYDFTCCDIITFKYDNNFERIGPITYDSVNSEFAKGIAVDSLGNFYVAGWTKSVLSGDDSRIIKYNPDGVEQWSITDDSMDVAQDVAVDSSGNIIVTGYFLTAPNDTDIVTAKYDSDGVNLWRVIYNGGYNDWGMGVVVDKLDNIYVGATSLFGSNNYRIIKYDKDDGSIIWNKFYDSGFDDTLNGIDIDDIGNVYVTGIQQDPFVPTPPKPVIRTIKYKQN